MTGRARRTVGPLLGPALFLVVLAAPSDLPPRALAAVFALVIAYWVTPDAIVYGSGMVPMTSMIRAGVVLNLGCGLAAWILLLALAG